MANQINKLTTKFVADTKQFDSEITKLKSGIKTFAVGAAASLAVVTAGFAAIATSIANTSIELDRIGKQAQVLKIQGKDLQFLSYAAELAGVSYRSLASTLERVGFRVNQAARGQKQYAAALKELNLDARQLSGLAIDKQFEAILTSLSKINNRGSQISLLRTLGGREAVSVINLLDSNLQNLRKTFDDFGLGLTNKQFKAIADYRDNVATLNTVWQGFKAIITAEVVPAFSELIQKTLAFIKSSGGIKPLAVQIGQSILTTISNIKSLIDITLNAINNVLAAINKVQSVTSNIVSGKNLQNNGLPFDPFNLDEFYKFKAESGGGSFIPNLQEGSTTSPNASGLQSLIPSISDKFGRLKDSTVDLIDTMSTGTTKISKIIESFTAGKAGGYLQELLQPSLERKFGSKRENDPFFLRSFEKGFRDVFEQTLGAGPDDASRLNSQLQRLERDALSFGFVQQEAVKELRTFTASKIPNLTNPDGMKEQKVKFEGKVAIFPDKQSFITFTQTEAEKLMAREAASIGAEE